MKKDVEEIAKEIFSEFEIEILDKIPVSFRCDCSEERMEQALISLGKEESYEKSSKRTKKLETVCHFCNKNIVEGEKLKNL